MKPLSDMTREELEMTLQSVGEELAAVEEERQYLLKQVGHISGQSARRYEIRINSLRKRVKEVEELLEKDVSSGDLPGF
ncbi:MAG: hypothetical protein ACYCX4_09300 [Bacillota bacterium]